MASYQQVLGSSGSEENARESCGLCLGVLRAWQEPLRALLSEEPKLEGEYLLSIDLPVVGALREQILLSLAEEEATVVELKDLLQWLIQDELGSRGFVQAKEPLKADVFTIHAAGDYSGNGTEILQSLQTPRSGTSRPSKKRRREEPPAALTASAVTKALSGLSKDELKTKLGLGDLSEGLQRPSAPASLRLQICRSEGFFIRGRYLKLSRRLPQSPWVIEGERKGDGSVEEDIATPVAKYFGASEVRFHAEGREDIDVRMLGPGRPFVLEVKNARNLSVKLAEVQSAVNAAGDRVEISELRECQAKDMACLQRDAENHRKRYLAVCWSEKCLSREDVEQLNQRGPFEVQQKTPVRVLHRRALATRPRTVYALRMEVINQHYFKLQVCAQAGMYIKEFVHGDLGRTKPSMRSFLQGQVEILQLDVEGVEEEDAEK